MLQVGYGICVHTLTFSPFSRSCGLEVLTGPKGLQVLVKFLISYVNLFFVFPASAPTPMP